MKSEVIQKQVITNCFNCAKPLDQTKIFASYYCNQTCSQSFMLQAMIKHRDMIMEHNLISELEITDGQNSLTFSKKF